MRDREHSVAPCGRAREVDLAAFALERAGAEWAEFRAHYPRCTECSREVARFALLADLLERELASPSEHPAERELLAFADARSALAAATRERIALHLEGCAACRSEASVLRRFDLGALAEAPSPALAGERIRGTLAWLGGALRLPGPAPAWALAAAALAISAVVIWSWREPGAAPPDSPAPPLAATTPAPARSEPAAEGTPVVTPDAAPPPSEIARAPIAPAPAPEAPAPSMPRPEAIAAAPGPALNAPEPAEEEALPAQRIASLVPVEPPHYAPGGLSAGPLVRVSGVGRGDEQGAPSPVALAPPHLGLTSREAPSLYWYLPGPTPLPVAVTIVDEVAAAPLLDETLEGPHAAGVHEVALGARGVRLAPGVDYQWFVAVVRDPQRRSRDLVSSAAIRYAPPDAELAGRLAEARERLAHAYAEAGLWYDAYDQLSRWLATEPDAARLRAHRAALLEQVGLAGAAASELSAAPASVPDP